MDNKQQLIKGITDLKKHLESVSSKETVRIIKALESYNNNLEGIITLKGRWTITLENIITGKKRIYHHENLIPTVGRTMIANNLTDSSPDDPLLVSHIALGSNATAPANGDTTLGTETYRNAVASRTNANNIGYVTGFFNATEVNGTFLEAGIFSNGSGSADSGILFSHVAINITKSAVETLTLDWTITIS